MKRQHIVLARSLHLFGHVGVAVSKLWVKGRRCLHMYTDHILLVCLKWSVFESADTAWSSPRRKGRGHFVLMLERTWSCDLLCRIYCAIMRMNAVPLPPCLNSG
eukprot:311659-Amphidinium_carterae.3